MDTKTVTNYRATKAKSVNVLLIDRAHFSHTAFDEFVKASYPDSKVDVMDSVNHASVFDEKKWDVIFIEPLLENTVSLADIMNDQGKAKRAVSELNRQVIVMMDKFLKAVHNSKLNSDTPYVILTDFEFSDTETVLATTGANAFHVKFGLTQDTLRSTLFGCLEGS